MNKTLFSLEKKVVGLYIGRETVDLVVLKGTLKGPKLIKFAQNPIYPIPPQKEEIVPAGQEAASGQDLSQKATDKKTKDEYIVEAIQKLFKENNIKPGDVVSAIANEEAMVRYFQMPKIPKQEWGSAIGFEAKRYIPFRMEDVVSDFQVIPSPSSPDSMDVVFAAVKKNAIARTISLLERAGARPLVIEPASLSIVRAFNAAGQIDHRINTAIVNINTKSANINILRNGVPYIIRDIPLDEGYSEGKSLEPIFEKLLSEIKLSFDFYEKQFPSEVIDKIIIYSCIPLENWHEIVGKQLQIPVEIGDPLRGIRVKKDIVPPRLAVCFGLALRGLVQPGIDINLCKDRMHLYKSKELFLKMLFLEASIAVFLLIIIKILCMKAIVPLTNEFNKTLSERPKAGISADIKDGSIPRLESIENEMSKEKDLLENVISKRSYFTPKLVDLAKIVPSNIWLTEVIFEEKVDKKDASRVSRQLNIKGYCIVDKKISETDIINNFLTDLKNSGVVHKGMKKADIISVEKTEMNNEKVATFEILSTGP